MEVYGDVKKVANVSCHRAFFFFSVPRFSCKVYQHFFHPSSPLPRPTLILTHRTSPSSPLVLTLTPILPSTPSTSSKPQPLKVAALQSYHESLLCKKWILVVRERDGGAVIRKRGMNRERVEGCELGMLVLRACR